MPHQIGCITSCKSRNMECIKYTNCLSENQYSHFVVLMIHYLASQRVVSSLHACPLAVELQTVPYIGTADYQMAHGQNLVYSRHCASNHSLFKWNRFQHLGLSLHVPRYDSKT